jgi:hypothetical protein
MRESFRIAFLYSPNQAKSKKYDTQVRKEKLDTKKFALNALPFGAPQRTPIHPPAGAANGAAGSPKENERAKRR